jgi:hypothetical protein
MTFRKQAMAGIAFACPPAHPALSRGFSFNSEVVGIVRNFSIEPKRTSIGSPWQNRVAERFVGSCCRDLLDLVIVLIEQHLKRPDKDGADIYTTLNTKQGQQTRRKADA